MWRTPIVSIEQDKSELFLAAQKGWRRPCQTPWNCTCGRAERNQLIRYSAWAAELPAPFLDEAGKGAGCLCFVKDFAWPPSWADPGNEVLNPGTTSVPCAATRLSRRRASPALRSDAPLSTPLRSPPSSRGSPTPCPPAMAKLSTILHGSPARDATSCTNATPPPGPFSSVRPLFVRLRKPLDGSLPCNESYGQILPQGVWR
jgi:hypothetical protein